MSQHVPEDLLQAFVDAEVGEQVAVHIAEHIDACPACATRAAGLEPLAAAFAAIRDPVPPQPLVASILARLDEPDRVPIPEIGIGVSLLLAAAALLVVLDQPLSMLIEAGVLLNTISTLARGAATALGSFPVPLFASTAVALLGALATLHFAHDPEHKLQAGPALRRLR
jgi:anti-sigma factor RsiW